MQTQKKTTNIKPPAVTYTLKYPIEFGSETITELKFSRPKGKHLKQIGQNITLGDIMIIASKISGVSPRVLDELDAADYQSVAGIISDFLDNGPENGESN